MDRRGIPIVISAPSGAGKTTLCHAVQGVIPGIEFSVSYTTRDPRLGETDGVDYHFVSDEYFSRMVEEGAFLEWADVHNHRYGTAYEATESQLAAGKDVFFDIDVEGGRQIAERLPDALLVLVLPPSMEDLEQRLRGRRSDSEEQIERRLAAAREEVRKAERFYPHTIVNADLGEAVAGLSKLITDERRRRHASNS